MISRKSIELYVKFHDSNPTEITEKTMWVPGGMVSIGDGVDAGYGIIDENSSKRGRYVHWFGNGVKVLRRPRKNENYDIIVKNFSNDLIVLGDCLGFTYKFNNYNNEIKLSSRNKLCTNENGDALFIISTRGVKYLLCGGKMHVSNWIRY